MDGQMGSTSIGMAELGQLFQACDRQRKGFIGREEFGDLCTSFQIESADADVIFADLDRDGDERIRLIEPLPINPPRKVSTVFINFFNLQFGRFYQRIL
jgi:hypothetical protein